MDATSARRCPTPPEDFIAAASGAGIVNEAFARAYFEGRNPVGESVDVRLRNDVSAPLEIAGYVRDAVYRDLREPMRPTVYVPMAERNQNTFLVRAERDLLGLAAALRARFPDTRPPSACAVWKLRRTSSSGSKSASGCSLFCRCSSRSLYSYWPASGSTAYSTIPLSAGAAKSASVSRSGNMLTASRPQTGATVALGSAAGIAAGLLSARFIAPLLFEVKATEFGLIAAPVAALAMVAFARGSPAGFARHANRSGPNTTK